MRHMTTHDLKKKVTYLKEEVPGSDGNYVVVEVIQEEEMPDEEIYEGEESDIEMQEDRLADEEEENYLLEREFSIIVEMFYDLCCNICYSQCSCTDLETEDVDYTVKKSPKANDPLTFGFSEDEEDEEN